MNIALASAWHPRGELRRFLRIWPYLDRAYTSIAISLPPETELIDLKPLQDQTNITLNVTRDWSWGRHAALRAATESAPESVHYADFDRLVRWVETRPEEWRHCLELIQEADGTIIERSEKAWHSHPQALRQTERIANLALSHYLGQVYDLSAGSKGFSRRAARFILANSSEIAGKPGRALGTDAEWPLLLYRGGFRLQSIQVDGLDWESADRYQEKPSPSMISTWPPRPTTPIPTTGRTACASPRKSSSRASMPPTARSSIREPPRTGKGWNF